MDWESIITGYKGFLKLEKGLSENSMEAYLAEEPIDDKVIMAAIRKATVALKLVPVLCGSAFRNKGVEPLLDAVVDLRAVGDPGDAPILAVQFFEAQGLQAFGMFSSDPANLTNNGHDQSTGFGVRLGYLGRFTDRFSLGFSWQSEIGMDEFSDYAGLFADQGGFDIPSSWTVGIAVHPNAKVTFVFDVQQTTYGDIPSIGNPLFPNLGIAFMGDPTYLLGGDNGPGFGWEDITTYKAGLQVAGNNGWTWRFGVSTGVYRWLGRDFPWGTLAVNGLGSFAMGLLFVLLLERTVG